MMIQNNNMIRIALATAFLLLLPLLAMQMTDAVDWDLTDFVFAGALLFGTGLMYVLAVRKGGTLAYRAAVGVALAAALLLAWANLAVGIIGNEENPANLVYFGLLVVGLIGAIAARFRPLGMARALFAVAIAQALVAVAALIAGRHQSPKNSVFEILAPHGFFVALWIGSALLFRRAAH